MPPPSVHLDDATVVGLNPGGRMRKLALNSWCDRNGIYSVVTLVDRNPIRSDNVWCAPWGGGAVHWHVLLFMGKKHMPTYFSHGPDFLDPGGNCPTREDVLDALATDAVNIDTVDSYEAWAQDAGYPPDSRVGRHVYCDHLEAARQLHHWLGEELYGELLYGVERLIIDPV